MMGKLLFVSTIASMVLTLTACSGTLSSSPRSTQSLPPQLNATYTFGAQTSKSTLSPSPRSSNTQAHLILSDQEFYFGEVIMSQGVVVKSIDISNMGPGALLLESTEPT